MSLTNASRLRSVAAGRMALVCLCTAATVRSEALTSSVVDALAGTGDTVWVATVAGLNFALDTTDSVPGWWARNVGRQRWGSLSFGDSRALATLDAAVDEPDELHSVFTGSFFTYNHLTAQARALTLRLNWVHAADTLERSAVCYASTRAADRWWLAYYDAGLVAWDGVEGVSFMPGVDGAASALDLFPGASVASRVRRDDTRAVFVAADTALADSPAVWVATLERIWRFSPADTTWDSLPNVFADPQFSLVGHEAVFVNGADTVSRVYASSTVRRGSGTRTCLFKYQDSAWVYVYGQEPGQSAPVGVSFAFGNRLYVADSTGLSLLVDSSAASPSTAAGRFDYLNRMSAATDQVPWNVLRYNDVLASDNGDGTARLWIATSSGLFFSRVEYPDGTGEPLVFANRPVRVSKPFAAPGILNDRNRDGRVYFTYRLDKPARVTIEVFDWNMDLVKVVVRGDGPRPASAAGPDAVPSTDYSRDYWDGTNESGRIVAPGVYYFRITTDSGERDFGKVVVALSR